MKSSSDAAPDYRVEVRLRNNRILSRIRRSGFTSVLAFCKARGLRYQVVAAYVTIRTPAIGRHGYRRTAVDLATALGVEPEDLFTERQARANLTPRVSREIDEQQALLLALPDVVHLPAPEEPVDLVIGRQKAVEAALKVLSPRERDLIRRLYGLDGAPAETEADLAAEWGIVRGRVNQIHHKALRKLKDSKAARLIRPYGDPDAVARCEAEEEERRETERKMREVARRSEERYRLNAIQRQEAEGADIAWQLAETNKLLEAAEAEDWVAAAVKARHCWQCRYVAIPFVAQDVLRVSWGCSMVGGSCREARAGRCGAEGTMFLARAEAGHEKQ